jgi:hypothetical protein
MNAKLRTDWVFCVTAFLLFIASGAEGRGGRVSVSRAESIHLTAGPGMAVYAPYAAGPSINGGIGACVNAGCSLFVGADLAVGFLGDVSSPFLIDSINNTGATMIQLLPTAYFRTPVTGLPGVRAYFGLSLGPNIFIQSKPISALQTSSETKVYFEFLLRPGLDLSVSRQVAFLLEPKLGILRSSFVFLPQLNTLVAF